MLSNPVDFGAVSSIITLSFVMRAVLKVFSSLKLDAFPRSVSKRKPEKDSMSICSGFVCWVMVIVWFLLFVTL